MPRLHIVFLFAAAARAMAACGGVTEEQRSALDAAASDDASATPDANAPDTAPPHDAGVADADAADTQVQDARADTTVPDSGALDSGSSICADASTSDWSFVDEHADGVVSSTRREGQIDPQTVTLNGKIYLSVTEVYAEDGSTSFTRRVRIFSYNGDDNAPHWNDVQGNLDVNGNPYAVEMNVANGKLYVVTSDSVTGAFDTWVYNGDDGAPAWTNLGHIGLRVDEPWSLVTSNGKLYLLGCNFQSNQSVQCDLNAAVYNGNDSAPHWQSLSLGGVGVGTGGQIRAIDVSGKLYVFFADDIQIGNANQPTHTRCFVYSGDDQAPAWTDVSGANGHINIDPRVSRSGAAAVGNELYVAIPENAVPRVYVYNGNETQPAWTTVDNGGLHGATMRTTLYGGGVALGVVGTTLHALWSDHGGIQSAVYGGNDGAPAWTLDRGACASDINDNELVDWYGNASGLVVNAGKLYATWSELSTTGAAMEQTRVAVRR